MTHVDRDTEPRLERILSEIRTHARRAAACSVPRRWARELPAGRRVAPSILSADYARLGSEVQEVMDAGARVIHVDVMDGHFVPPITIGPLIVERPRASRSTPPGGFIDVHLMIERPERQVEEFAQRGRRLDLDPLGGPRPTCTTRSRRSARPGSCAGLAINPATPPEAVAGRVGLRSTSCSA